MVNTTGTPLTRYGSRVPITPPIPTLTVAVPPAVPVKVAPPLVVTPKPTIRAMIVCIPDDLPTDALNATRRLDTHFGVQGSVWARFWAKPLNPWRRHHMIDLRRGRPSYCAGGPLRLLDLSGMHHAAAVGAGLRYQQWTQVVHGTRSANPWHAFEARHLAEPTKYPLHKAKADFDNQARVNAMSMHNAVNYGAGQFVIDELEMLQAGPLAYQHYSAAIAVVGDAILTAEGNKLAPESDAMAHRVAYIERANRYLDTLPDTQRLLAVAL